MGDDDHQRGWDDAESFIARHPHGMPWAALPDDEDDDERDNEHERDYREGWRERMREEGWPLSRREASEGHEP